MIELPHFWNELPNSIRTRFGEKRIGRQRAMIADGHLLLILHRAPQTGKTQREARFFWRKPNGSWQGTGGDGLVQLAEHLREFDQAEDQLNASYERASSAEDHFRVIEQAVPLARSARNLHATLQSAREAIPADRDLINFRDWAYEIERSLDLLQTSTKNALDFRIAHQAEEQARLGMESLKLSNRLNLLAAIFFPLMALSGVFGMNLPSGLERSSTGVFWFLFLVGLLAGVIISWWVVRDIKGLSNSFPKAVKTAPINAAPPTRRRR